MSDEASSNVDEASEVNEEAAKKPARKTAAKKTAAEKKPAAKKPAAKKTATKKTAAKKKAASEEAEDKATTVAAEADENAQDKTAAKKAPTKRGRKKKTETASKEEDSTKAEDSKEEKSEKPEKSDSEDKASSEEDVADASSKDKEQAAGEEQDSSNGARRRMRRSRRSNNNTRREVVPSATRDELANLADDELVAKAVLLEVDPTEYGERDDLVSAVYDSLLQAEGFVMVEGILDILPDGYGFIRTGGYLPGDHDVYVGASMVRRNGLRKGDYINGRVRPPRDNEKYPALNMIVLLNGEPFEGPTRRVKFANLTPIYPDERLIMEHGASGITARAIDLVAPIGKGQRGLIVSPPKAGKTTVLKDIAAAISANDPDVHLMCLLIDERPEEVTDMERSIDGEVISSTFDMPCENHIAVAELVIERAKRLVETGQDVVILLDSITRLARAYNLGQPASGRILSGGVDSTALYPPKRFLGAARNIEGGGSLTILGTALIETGSKMDEVIFEEFKGTGNMELKLDRSLADRRIFPAIDPIASGTRKEELLLDPQEAPLIWGLRRLLANMNNPERAMDMLVKSLKQTDNNREFLIKSAKKAQKNSAVAEAF
jgi:transcription termination factor Rho